MRKHFAKLLLAGALVVLAQSGVAALFLKAPAGYQSTCDLTTCAETWSVERAKINSYSGALFRVVNTTGSPPFPGFDVPQTTARVADVAALNSFCGGNVVANCLGVAVYGQIHVGQNTLVSKDDVGFTIAIDSNTGLPVVDQSTSQNCMCLGTIGQSGNDFVLVGAPGGVARSVSGVMRGVQTTGACCGNAGWTHSFSEPLTFGTDFELAFNYEVTWNYGASDGPENHCPTSFCLTLDNEGVAWPIATSYSVPTDQWIIATFDGTTGTLSYNGHQQWSQAACSGVVVNCPPGWTINPGNHIHIAGGGDCTNPAPLYWYEMEVTASAMSAPDQAAVLADVKRFYASLSFP